MKFSIKLFFYVFLLLLPFDNEFAVSGVSVVTFVGFFLLIAVLANRTFFFKWHFIFFLLLIMFTIGTVTDFLRLLAGAHLGFGELVHTLMLFLLFLITYSISIRGELRTIIWFIYASTIILLLYQLFFSSDLNVHDLTDTANQETRLTTLGSDPNFVASYLCLGMLMSIYLVINAIAGSKLVRYVSWILAPLFMYGIIITGSRGGVVALLFGLLTLVFTFRGVKKQLLYLTFITILCSFGFFIIMQDESFLYRLQLSIVGGDLAGRDYIWQKAWYLTSDLPLLGFGYYGYMSTLGPLTGSVLKVTHNTYLAIILSTGWIGTIFFASWYFYVLKTAWSYRMYPFGNFLFSAMIVCSISALSVNLELTKWFWIVLALVISSKKAAKIFLVEKMKL